MASILKLSLAIFLSNCRSSSGHYRPGIDYQVSSGVKHINTNLSWFGPVLVTHEPGYYIHFDWDITVPVVKCCPGLVVLSSNKKENLLQMRKDCMDIEQKNLKFLYAESRTYIPIDYGYLDKGKMCYPPNSGGYYRCKEGFYQRSQTKVYYAAFLFDPCHDENGLEMSYRIDFRVHPNKFYECFEFSSLDSMSVCSNYYNSGYVPNLMGGIAKTDDLLVLSAMFQEGSLRQCHKYFF